MKFIPNGTMLLVQELEVSENSTFARGNVVASNAHEGLEVYGKGATVLYGKCDRRFLGLGFPNDFVVVRDEDVVGWIKHDGDVL